MSDIGCSTSAVFTPSGWCIIGRDLQCFWQGPVMHHPDVVNITQNNVEINLVLSKTWKYILDRRTRRFFLFTILFLMARYGGLFL
ncbi:hypothetical protein LZ617_10205 [Escherichia coli]|uniref:hypothetical protein n=1 Tax=Escherichia coli TaxID=562 RepID=UPI001F216242|nr:hypothetical protein [Escherichia coli]MCE9973366.1 hypothetical protein [Escherichia coli]MCE9987445.1 hypothetical protein [Escherichia coli]